MLGAIITQLYVGRDYQKMDGEDGWVTLTSIKLFEIIGDILTRRV